MKIGRISWFSQMNGYGFILSHDGREYFVHRTALAAYPYFPPRKYDLVSFELKKAAKGLQAIEVKLIKSKKKHPLIPIGKNSIKTSLKL